MPIIKIISRYYKSILNCRRVSQIADRTYIYDNSIDNQEVRLLFRMVDGKVFKRYTCTNDTDLALRELQAYLEGLPYVEGFKKKLEEVTVAEGFYEWTFYLIFSMLNVYVQTQVKCARGVDASERRIH